MKDVVRHFVQSQLGCNVPQVMEEFKTDHPLKAIEERRKQVECKTEILCEAIRQASGESNDRDAIRVVQGWDWLNELAEEWHFADENGCVWYVGPSIFENLVLWLVWD